MLADEARSNIQNWCNAAGISRNAIKEERLRFDPQIKWETSVGASVF